MTLDLFQKGMDDITTKLKQEMTNLLQKGIEAKLDEEIMLAIINRSLEKLGDLE